MALDCSDSCTITEEVYIGIKDLGIDSLCTAICSAMLIMIHATARACYNIIHAGLL